jgi:hypothetical protein
VLRDNGLINIAHPFPEFDTVNETIIDEPDGVIPESATIGVHPLLLGCGRCNREETLSTNSDAMLQSPSHSRHETDVRASEVALLGVVQNLASGQLYRDLRKVCPPHL